MQPTSKKTSEVSFPRSCLRQDTHDTAAPRCPCVVPAQFPYPPPRHGVVSGGRFYGFVPIGQHEHNTDNNDDDDDDDDDGIISTK